MKTILIADDSLYLRITLKKILTEGGYTVIGEAIDGADAISKYAALSPDLVMLDITMPAMDGITAARFIKEKNPLAKIIMCSAMSQQSMVLDAINAGASDFVIKPFQAGKIIKTVEKFIGKATEQ